MTPGSALLLLGLAAAAGLGAITFRGVRNIRREIAAHDDEQEALRARMAERGRVLAARAHLEATQRSAEVAIDVGTESVRAVHQTIADISFGMLQKDPDRKGKAHAVRKAHDTAAETVYDAISFVNKLTGEGLRRGIHRGPRPTSGETPAEDEKLTDETP